MGSKKQYQAHVELVLKKEKDPHSVSFAEICRYAGHNDWPMTIEQVIEKESNRYGQMADFVRGWAATGSFSSTKTWLTANSKP